MANRVTYQYALDELLGGQGWCAGEYGGRPTELFIAQPAHEAHRRRHVALEQFERLLPRAVPMLPGVLLVELVRLLAGERRERLTRRDRPDPARDP